MYVVSEDVWKIEEGDDEVQPGESLGVGDHSGCLSFGLIFLPIGLLLLSEIQ